MKLPLTYDNYIFDLYGTLVDIHTDESDTAIWEKLAMFYGYYGALYEAKELKERYETLVKSSEAELKKKNVYLLSNAQRIFTAYEMRRLDIFDLFDDVFISSDYNTKKPDIRFYKELINKHDIDVSKSLFIGNDSTTDIKGAKECRMDAFYVKSNISPKDDMAHDADYIIDNFTNW